MRRQTKPAGMSNALTVNDKGKVTFRTALTVSTSSNSGSCRTTTAAKIFWPSLLKAQSTPATTFGYLFSGVRCTLSARLTCRSLAREYDKFQLCNFFIDY
jgi:hypothetical protein